MRFVPRSGAGFAFRVVAQVVGVAGVGWAECGMSSEVAAMAVIVFPSRITIATLGVRRITSLGLVSLLASCAPGDVKDGLAPNEPEAVAVAVTPAKSSIFVGEVVVVRATAQTSDGQPASAQVDWTADWRHAPRPDGLHCTIQRHVVWQLQDPRARQEVSEPAGLHHHRGQRSGLPDREHQRHS